MNFALRYRQNVRSRCSTSLCWLGVPDFNENLSSNEEVESVESGANDFRPRGVRGATFPEKPHLPPWNSANAKALALLLMLSGPPQMDCFRSMRVSEGANNKLLRQSIFCLLMP